MLYESARLADFSFSELPSKRKRMDPSFLSLVIILLTMGVIMVLSSSYARAYYDPGSITGGNPVYFFIRQLVYALFGTAVMIGASFVPLGIYKKYAFQILGGVIILLLLVPFIGVKANGARRWIGAGGLTVQPSELAKLAVIISFSVMICKNKTGMRTVRYGIIPFALVIAVIIGLLILEPHFSASVIIAAIGGIMMFLGGVRLVWFAAAFLAAGGGITVLLTMFPYASERITTWRDPFASSSDEGYQIIQSLYSIGSGGLSGLGFGCSRQKFLYLPEEHNDFIFSVLCEETGFIGASLVIILFSLLILRGYWIALHCQDAFSFLVCAGISSLLAVQVFLNIAVVTNLIPCTGISLPFFSYGGTALMLDLFEMGIILSASRNIIC